jgi:hypothetical protein
MCVFNKPLLWCVVESFSACTNTKAALVYMCCCSSVWLNLFQHAQTRYCSAVCLLATTTPKARYCSSMWLQAFEHAQTHRKQPTALSSVSLRAFKYAQTHRKQPTALSSVSLRVFKHAQPHGRHQAAALACVCNCFGPAWTGTQATI